MAYDPSDLSMRVVAEPAPATLEVLARSAWLGETLDLQGAISDRLRELGGEWVLFSTESAAVEVSCRCGWKLGGPVERAEAIPRRCKRPGCNRDVDVAVVEAAGKRLVFHQTVPPSALEIAEQRFKRKPDHGTAQAWAQAGLAAAGVKVEDAPGMLAELFRGRLKVSLSGADLAAIVRTGLAIAGETMREPDPEPTRDDVQVEDPPQRSKSDPHPKGE